MNFVAEAGDMIAPAQPQAGGDPSGPDAVAFQKLSGHRVRLFQPQMTHRARAEVAWGRLDRIYSSLPLGVLGRRGDEMLHRVLRRFHGPVVGL